MNHQTCKICDRILDATEKEKGICYECQVDIDEHFYHRMLENHY